MCGFKPIINFKLAEVEFREVKKACATGTLLISGLSFAFVHINVSVISVMARDA